MRPAALRVPLVAALCLHGLPTWAADAEPPSSSLQLAVLDLEAGPDIDADLTGSLNAVVGAAAQRNGSIQVITQRDIRHMLSFDRLQVALSCEEQASCLAEIGGALGVPYLLSGSVNRLGEARVVSLVLIEIARAQVLGRETVQVGEAALPQEVEQAVLRLLAPLLREAAGSLQVRTDPAEAQVVVDDRLVGVSPTEALELAAGRHRITVSRPGFIAFSQDLTLAAREHRTLELRLRPSPEFLAEHRATAQAQQIAAGSSAGVAGLSLLGGLGLLLWNEVERQAICARERDVCALFGREPSYATSDEIGRQFARDVGGFALLGLSVALTAGATYLWLVAEPVDKYDHLLE